MIIADKYEVIDEVGKGGMGVVYRVRHLDLDTTLALKMLPRELSEDPELVERFRREARVMAKLAHRNIVSVLDFSRDGDSYYLAMEFLNGRNLRDYLRDHMDVAQRPLALPDVLRIGSQVARALAYAHGQEPPVVHRDIKPSNILVEERTGRIVVMDFGIAKVLGDAQVNLTRTGVFVGTVKYCAPEQMKHLPDVDGGADVYSLGLVLYELFTGEQLFRGLTEQEVIARVLSDREEDLSALIDAQPEFGAIVDRAISRDRDRRYRTADALLADLQALLRRLAPEEVAREQEERADDLAPGESVRGSGGGGPDARTGESSISWFSATDAATEKPTSDTSGTGFATEGREAVQRRRGVSRARQMRAAMEWTRARWWALALVLPALAVALLSVLEGVAWIGRPFPGFLLMRNAVVPTIAAYHWTGMRAELPFHSTVLEVGGTPLAHSNDVYAHAGSVPEGSPVAYTLLKDGETFERRVATMTFRGYDYALTLGLFAFNGLVILVMGAIVGLLSPQNRQARVFLLASVLMGVYALSSTDLYRAHRFWELHWLLQCITPAALIHLALVFPVERATGATGRVLVAVPYLGGAVLGVVLLRGMAASPVDLRPFYASFVFTVIALLTLVAGSLLAYVQYRRAVVRGRVQIVLVGVVAAFLLPAFGYFNNIFGGGDLPLNLSGAVTPTFFILAVAYAIARHKLFDVQLIVRRSVVFACLLAAFTTLYVAAVSALDLLLTAGDLRTSPAFTGAFMGVSLALAFPLRDRLSAIIAARLFPHKHRAHQTIREISQAIASMVDLDAILAKVLAALERDMGLATGAVLLRHEAGGGFVGVAAFGMSVAETAIAGDGPLARLLDTTRAEVFLDDIEEDTALTGVKEACLPVFAALEADLLLPLFSDTGMVGVLALGRTRGGDPLTSEDVELLRSLAAGIGLAVARSLDATRAERMALHRQVLERHLPATSVRNVVGQDAAGPAARRVRVTALCVRLGDFPAFAERAGPERAVEILKGYYGLCDRLLRQYAGTAERYEGELATLIFGAPVATPDHAVRAARVAIALRRELEEKRAAWREQEYDLAVTCGIATGVAYVGLIATGSQGTYAGLGLTMDIAEELCTVAEAGVILAHAETAAALPAEIVTAPAGTIRIGAAPTPIDASRVEEERAAT